MNYINLNNASHLLLTLICKKYINIIPLNIWKFITLCKLQNNINLPTICVSKEDFIYHITQHKCKKMMEIAIKILFESYMISSKLYILKIREKHGLLSFQRQIFYIILTFLNINDIIQLKKTNTQFHILSYHKYAQETITITNVHSKKISILHFNIYHFKYINIFINSIDIINDWNINNYNMNKLKKLNIKCDNYNLNEFEKFMDNIKKYNMLVNDRWRTFYNMKLQIKSKNLYQFNHLFISGLKSKFIRNVINLKLKVSISIIIDKSIFQYLEKKIKKWVKIANKYKLNINIDFIIPCSDTYDLYDFDLTKIQKYVKNMQKKRSFHQIWCIMIKCNL